MNLSFKILITTLILLFSGYLSAAEEAETAETEEVSKEPFMYYQISPNIMTFYQNTGRKMGYIVVQVQVVVRGQEDFDTVELHLPLLQDTLVGFFNSQDKATIQDLQQREVLRNQAKEKVAEVLKEELGRDIVENLLFTQYVFQ